MLMKDTKELLLPLHLLKINVWECQVSKALNYLTTVVIQSLALSAAAPLGCLVASMYIHHPVCLVL